MKNHQHSVRVIIFALVIFPVIGAAIKDNGRATVVAYRAAATQYTPSSDWSVGAAGILQHNFNTILELAQNASLQGADIIVLPEYGLTGTDLGQNRTMFKGLCQKVPDPAEGRVPCTEDVQTDNYWMMQSLSCLALQLDMYIVVDLAELALPVSLSMENDSDDTNLKEEACPPPEEKHDNSDSMGELCSDDRPDNSGTSKSSPGEENAEEDFTAYNTQVVFDRTGAVVARYRKKHLFFEPEFEYGYENDSTALFTTDFGVTFTLQVCFDIMYSSPAVANVVQARVRDVAMSTAWIDELPFLTAPQIFRGFSRGMSSNLIVSNLFNPDAGEMGSGIFHRDLDKGHKYTYDSDLNQPVLIVDDLTTEVDGDLWMSFKENEKLTTTKLVTKILESFSESESANGGQHGNFLDSSSILQNNSMSNIVGFLRDSRLFNKSEAYVRKILGAMFSTMRQVSEWERFRNEAKCLEACRKVKFLLANRKSFEAVEHLKIPDENSLMSLDTKQLDTSGPINPSFDPKTTQFRDDSKSEGILTSHANKNYQFIIHENISFYAHEVLKPFGHNASVTTCYASFCCEVEYSFLDDSEIASMPNAGYMLLAYNGTVAKGGGTYWMWTQVCGVVFCVDQNDVNSCAALDEPMPDLSSGFRLRSITGNFQISFIFPSVFGLNFQLVNHTSWSSNTVPAQLYMQGDVNNLLTAVLFGRKYSLDP